MKGFQLTLEGRVLPEWIDANGHMNITRYLALFDEGCEVLLLRSGVDRARAATGDVTLVAGRIQMAHRREMLEGESWSLWSGFTSVDPGFVSFTHRLVGEGSVRATCDIRANAFCKRERASSLLGDEVVERARALIVPGLKDPFAQGLGR